MPKHFQPVLPLPGADHLAEDLEHQAEIAPDLINAANTRLLGARATEPQSSYPVQTPAELGTQPTVFDSLGAAFSTSGFSTGVYNYFTEDDMPAHVDPDYKLGDDLYARVKAGDHADLITDILDHPNVPINKTILQKMADVGTGLSSDKTAYLLSQRAEMQKVYEIMGANGWEVALAGGLLGMIPDVAGALALITLSAGVGVPIAGMLSLKRLNDFRRLAGAVRVSGEAATFAAAERYMQSLTDPLIDNEQIITAAKYGAAGGALLGAAFPKAVGRIGPRKNRTSVVDDEARIMDDMASPGDAPKMAGGQLAEGPEWGGAGVGAEAVSDEFQGVVHSSGFRGFADRLFSYGKFRGGNSLRNSKEALEGLLGAFTRMADKYGMTGGLVYSTGMRKLMKMRRPTRENLEGTPDPWNAQTKRQHFEEMRQKQDADHTKRYEDMTEDLWGAGFISNTLANNDVAKLGPVGIAQPEWSRMAGKMARAEHDKNPVQRAAVIDDLQSRFGTEDADKIVKHLDGYAKAENRYYEAMGFEEVKYTLIGEDDLIGNYRPQLAIRENIEYDIVGFDHMMYRVFHGQVDMDWVEQQGYAIATKGAKGEADTITPLVAEGMVWSDLVKKYPREAREIMEDWSLYAKRSLEDKKLELVLIAEDQLKTLQIATRQEFEELYAAKIAAGEDSLRAANRARARAKSPKADDAGATSIGKIERQLQYDRAAFDRAARAWGNVDEIDETIKRYGSAPTKKGVKKAKSKLSRAIAAEAATAKALTFTDRVAKIRNAYINGDDPFGFAVDDAIATTGRAYQRKIEFKDEFYSDDYGRFFETNDVNLRMAHQGSVGSQLALRARWPHLAPEGKKFDMKGLEDEILGDMLADRKFLGEMDPADAAEYRRLVTQSQNLFHMLINEFTRKDMILMNRLTHGSMDVANLGMSVAAATMLGRILFSVFGDAGVLAMAGQRAATGFEVFWRGAGRQIVKELSDAGEPFLAAQLMGPNVRSMSSFYRNTGLDFDNMDMAGGWMRKVSRVARSISVAEGWLSGLHPWNRLIRQGFALDYARQLTKDMADFANIPASRRTWYANKGIGATQATRLNKLLREKGTTVADGQLTVPNSVKWANSDPEMLRLYQSALREAGDEAMIDPGIGDKGVWMRTTVIGKMVGAFQGFMMTAGNRFITPMIQRGYLHPTDVQPYIAIMLSVQIAIAADGMRMFTAGRGQEWMDNWDTFDGTRDNLSVAMMRSALFPGMSAMLTELLANNTGRQVNDILEAMGAPRLAPQARARYMERGVSPILGPLVGLTQRGIKVTGALLEGDMDRAWAIGNRMIPLYNTILFQAIAEQMYPREDR